MTLLWVIVLFLVACVLILTEFLLPHGILGLLGAVLLVGGCIWGMVSLPGYAAIILIVEVLGALLTIVAGMYLLANTRAGNALKLHAANSSADGFQNMPTDTSLVGREGTVITKLRPAGTVDIDGRRIDVTADGAFIEQGATVRVLSVSGNYIVVERA